MYRDTEGRRITDADTLRRIEGIVIPPAWRDVWICPSEWGHIQATGRDARGRKVYRYHPRWREVRDADKFAHTIAFAAALPRIRRRVARDLRREGMPRERVIAAAVRLLETTLIRVGNEEYARANGTYGLTTLRTRHVRLRGRSMRFVFRGKTGVERTVGISDRRVAAVIRRCQELPGQRLLRYVDDDGEIRTITSSDVNAYLEEAAGVDVTAKDFRTWAGTVLCARELQRCEPVESRREGERAVVAAVDAVAEQLGNTRAVCRRSYIHPALIDAYLESPAAPLLEPRSTVRGLSADEAAVLRALRRAAGRGKRPSRRLRAA
ncbi:MAG TPA: DNA topoisomerase IB [Candidatus Dormibacteraeota bacterium]